MKNCGYCHTCGTKLRKVLDGEEWCPKCETYRRYIDHGWSWGNDPSSCTPADDYSKPELNEAEVAEL